MEKKKITWISGFEANPIRANFKTPLSKKEVMELYKLWGDAYFTHYGFDEVAERKEKKAVETYLIAKKELEKILGFSFEFKADSNWFELIEN